MNQQHIKNLLADYAAELDPLSQAEKLAFVNLFKNKYFPVARNCNVVYGYFTVQTMNCGFEYMGKYFSFRGYVCVRLDRPEKGSDSNAYKASFSFCSPEDAPMLQHELGRKFKALSKKIADDRMEASKKQILPVMRKRRQKSIQSCAISFEYKVQNDEKLPDLFAKALDEAIKADIVPEWLDPDKTDIKYGLHGVEISVESEKAA